MINITMTSSNALSTVELSGKIREIATGSFTINNLLNIDITIPKEQLLLKMNI